jgi:hypothetical protein
MVFFFFFSRVGVLEISNFRIFEINNKPKKKKKKKKKKNYNNKIATREQTKYNPTLQSKFKYTHIQDRGNNNNKSVAPRKCANTIQSRNKKKKKKADYIHHTMS